MSRIIINNRTQLSDKDALETVYLAWNSNPTGITLLANGYGVAYTPNDQSIRVDVMKMYEPNVLAPETAGEKE